MAQMPSKTMDILDTIARLLRCSNHAGLDFRRDAKSWSVPCGTRSPRLRHGSRFRAVPHSQLVKEKQ